MNPRLITLLLALPISMHAAHAPREVLLAYNADSAVSTAIAHDYAARRKISNIVQLHCADSATTATNETISFANYNAQIAAPISAFLAHHPGINFIVLTKGVPIRIDGAPTGSRDEHTTGNYRASVDSYLAAVDYPDFKGAKKISIHGSGADGFAWLNRYWNSTESFTHKVFGGYLVTRLDGYTQADAMALVSRALSIKSPKPDATQKVLFDVQPAFGLGDKATQPISVTGNVPDESTYDTWNADMIKAADLLSPTPIAFELDTTPIFVGNRSNLLGYFSWGSNDQNFDPAAYESLTFAPGSIGDTAVSTSARSLLPTHDGGQSLVADLVAHGITGVKGYTDEPLLQAIASPSVLVDRYFIKGMTLAESFYAASRFVGWTDVVIGDPLATFPSPRRPHRVDH